MAHKTLEEAMRSVLPDILRWQGVTGVDEKTLDRIVRISAPGVRDAMKSGTVNYEAAAETSRKVREILRDAGYLDQGARTPEMQV